MEKTHVGPFLIVKKLGNRRQKVYHARQTEQNRDVALKFISIPPTVEWSKALEKIEREVVELQKLRHENLVQVYGAGVDEERIFFASELVDGESLASIMARRGKIAPDLVVEYGRQIAECLRYIHAKDLIHSKLTPEKILIGNDGIVKIADLRLNRSKRRRWDSPQRRELDIAAYMAPEQFTEGATAKSDFYALGVILFEMLTGKLPYAPDTMGRMTQMKMNAPVPSAAKEVMNCPIWLDKIISQMLSPDVRKRPHSARAISLAFDEIKKMDASKKAAVSQVSGGFNALTAGQDKSEARKLLGIKKPKKKKIPEIPFYQTAAFQIIALICIAAIMGGVAFKMWRSVEQRIADAAVMVESDDPAKWSMAQVDLQKIMDSKSELAEDAEALFYRSRRKSLVRQADNEMSHRLQTWAVQQFCKGVRLQKDGDAAAAIELFAELVATVDPDGMERHVYRESLARMNELESQIELPTDVDELRRLIASLEKATDPGKMVSAHDMLARICLEYSGMVGYDDVVKRAIAGVETMKQRIAASKLDPTEPAAGSDPSREQGTSEPTAAPDSSTEPDPTLEPDSGAALHGDDRWLTG